MLPSERMVRMAARGGLCLVLAGVLAGAGWGQQVVQRGALGRPAQVMDETQQWTSALEVAGSEELAIYVPDVSSTAWLAKNYADYENKGIYTVSMFTQYLKPRACRGDLVRWGFADAAHLDACAVDIAYRVRSLQVDTLQRTVTLLNGSMVGQDGQLLTDGNATPTATRRWADLDPTALGAVRKTTELVASQMSGYDRRMRGVH